MIASTTAAADSLCLRLEGALDGAGAASLRPGFEALGTHGPRDVVLDLSGVSYLDGAGLGAVAYLYKRLVAQGRRLRLQGVTGQPLATLRQLGLGRVFGLESRAARFPLPSFGKGFAWAR